MGAYVETSGVPRNSALYRAMQKMRPFVYSTRPHQDGVEFLLPQVRPTKGKLLH